MSAEDLLILDVESLTNAKIGQLVETLKFYKRHYALVSEKAAPDDMQLIGYFSASAICKRLGVTPELQNDETTENIIELQRLLKEFD